MHAIHKFHVGQILYIETLNRYLYGVGTSLHHGL